MKGQLQLQSLYIGIDVAKLTLDVSCLNQAGQHFYEQFQNTKVGLQRLNRWLLQQEGFAYTTALFCMEQLASTQGYWLKVCFCKVPGSGWNQPCT